MFKKAYVPSGRVQSKIDPKTGMTHQSFKDECDINYLVEHWSKTGVMPSFNHRQPVYADVADVPDMHHAANLVAFAEQHFAELPADEREKYDDALHYLEAVSAALEDPGTIAPLDVIVPTDTKDGQKGGSNDKIPQTDV